MSSQQKAHRRAQDMANRWQGIVTRLQNGEDLEIEEFSGEEYRHSDLEREAAMRAAAWTQIERLMFYDEESGDGHNWETEILTEDGLKVGPEVEYQVYRDTVRGLEMIDGDTKSRILEELDEDDIADTEVGAMTIEGKAGPQEIKELDTLTKMIMTTEKKILKSAANEDAGLLRLGAIPFEFDSLERTDEEKYDIVPKFHNKFDDAKGPIGNIGLEVEDAALAGSIFSSQLNMLVPSLDMSVSLMNQSIAWQPYAVRLAGNSRYFKGKDLGVPESRNDIWNKTHDAGFMSDEEYIGEIGSYVEDFTDYLERTLDRPIIMNTEDHEDGAREIAEGIYWKDTRIKFDEDNDEVIVEFRAPPVQTTALEDVAVQAFTTGRSLYGQFWGESELPDIETLKKNRRLAYEGSNEMYDPDGELRNIGFLTEAEEGLSEIDKAERGLRMAGVNHEIGLSTEELLDMGYDRHEVNHIQEMDSYLDVLRERVYRPDQFEYATGTGPEAVTPSDEFSHFIEDGDVEEALKELGAFQSYAK